MDRVIVSRCSSCGMRVVIHLPSHKENGWKFEGIILQDPVLSGKDVMCLCSVEDVPMIRVSAVKNREKDLVFLKEGQRIRMRGVLIHKPVCISQPCICGGERVVCYPEYFLAENTRIIP